MSGAGLLGHSGFHAEFSPRGEGCFDVVWFHFLWSQHVIILCCSFQFARVFFLVFLHSTGKMTIYGHMRSCLRFSFPFAVFVWLWLFVLVGRDEQSSEPGPDSVGRRAEAVGGSGRASPVKGPGSPADRLEQWPGLPAPLQCLPVLSPMIPQWGTRGRHHVLPV